MNEQCCQLPDAVATSLKYMLMNVCVLNCTDEAYPDRNSTVCSCMALSLVRYDNSVLHTS